MKEENIITIVLIVLIVVSVFQTLQLITLNSQIAAVYAAPYQGAAPAAQGLGGC